LLVLATAVEPRTMLFGFIAVLLSVGTAQLLRLSPDLTRSGLFGYNALLVALGGASLVQHTAMGIGLLVLAVMGSVLVTAAIHSALGTHFALPALTLPFLAVFYLVLGAAPLADIPLRSLTTDPLALELGMGPAPRLYLQSLGALFFLPRIDAGAFVLLALVVHSRIGTTLSLLAFTIVALFRADLFVLADPTLAIMLGYNCVLIAVALGGVWFVPSPPSFVLASIGVLMGGLFTLGALPRLALAGVPLLILPFNLTVFLVLYAMRQRVRDGNPKAVDFLIGTPEENLNYFRTRLARFGSLYASRLHLPFLGRWTCTQGVQGAITHKGPWRHALDFQVRDSDGQLHRGTGAELGDYHCYRLPVLACGSGVVAKVVDGVDDNPVGEVNLRDNWGNVVILYHAPGLYSLVGHLAKGSVRVREGQPVKTGETLGLCGNSGRSPVPHLHFQLQATARIGAPTLALELHDVVIVDGEQELLRASHVPTEGQVVRGLEPQADIARQFDIEYGSEITLTLDGDGTGRTECVVADIDLYGNLLLRSKGRNARLYYDRTDKAFTVYDVVGTRSKVLRLVHACLSRVPFEASEKLGWNDFLPAQNFVPPVLRPLSDIVAPFVGKTGVEMVYRAERKGTRLLVRGESTWHRDNKPVVVTEAELADHEGIERLEMTVRGHRIEMTVRGHRTVAQRKRAPMREKNASTRPLVGVGGEV
jgi:murein DD-endopeptidase MepM/ murein hydrolase activator NlpD/urea transporter